ncbi:hypothetical protein [Adhaeribacter aquaticus]|uniref:hypothetical protein n=1 Tax=Adhaeribacter aquaticus TaxID=299567 RepID=UPI000408307F|nr:hypothetical protein [Adhaeribacter aquaticus]
MKNYKLGLTLILVVVSATLVLAQTFSKQGISFTLFDKSGNQLTNEAITSGQVKVYSLRPENAAKEQQLSYNRITKRFIFTESAISPGISLALASPTDTMYISVYGRSGTDRVIEGLKVQRGSYVLTSNEFAGRKLLKVDNWEEFLEDETPAAEQDLSAYRNDLRDKKEVTLVEGLNN